MTPDILLLASPASNDGPSMHRYARELYAALQALPPRHRVAIEQPARHGPHGSGVSRRLAEAWFRYITYPRALRGRQAGVFHVLDQAYAHLLRTLPPDRTLVTCHDLIPLLAAEGAIRLPMPATVARSFRWRVAQLGRARAVIAVSDATRATLERYTSVGRDRITVVPQGVSPVFRRIEGARDRIRASARLTPHDAVVLQVSSGARYKNTPAVLHALAQLRQALDRPAVLVRIGARLRADERELAVRLGVIGAVLEVGTVDDGTLAEWYSAADVLAFPSIWEGFGWPPLEAMACGTPVVASRIDPIEEVVNDAGLLVAPEDHAALSAALLRVLTEPALVSSLRQRGLARAAQFTWARTAAATAAVYDSILH